MTTQVRDVARHVNTNRKRVEATRASRALAERRLDAEQKKFAAGMSTNFLVFQAQRDLAPARNAELQAILDYNRSIVDFETVQDAPLNGGGGSAWRRRSAGCSQTSTQVAAADRALAGRLSSASTLSSNFGRVHFPVCRS